MSVILVDRLREFLEIIARRAGVRRRLSMYERVWVSLDRHATCVLFECLGWEASRRAHDRFEESSAGERGGSSAGRLGRRQSSAFFGTAASVTQTHSVSEVVECNLVIREVKINIRSR